MPVSLILAFLWALMAGLTVAAPRRLLYPAAWVLIASGIPLLGLITIQAGPVWGLIGLGIGAVLIGRPGFGQGET
ncbi:DUF2484 family protein [Roseibacterium sp. SDUM158016]|uniref:DUF2484 family protein n=1 Tax=Roseicyclus sediminis TaxID=2980997 RepID=UPI0021D15DAF|nr:DUF2484 family protein [Roseibacterium sp. SDUM158016]MCU4652883.1 DUF2484 family protein [Roseibacterium sp. SDUM158016]